MVLKVCEVIIDHTGPVVVAEAAIVKGKHEFEFTVPDEVNGQSLPMSFRDNYVTVEYRIVGYDATTNEQLKGHLPIQIMTPVFINEFDPRVMKIEKQLKTLGVFTKGQFRVAIRINNPELRPGDDLSIKVPRNESFDYVLFKIFFLVGLQRQQEGETEKSGSVAISKSSL